MNANKLITVVPCYNEEAILNDTHNKLSSLYEKMIADGVISNDSTILYVNDGSSDLTWDIITKLHQSKDFACGLKLAHNVGHQNALLAGL